MDSDPRRTGGGIQPIGVDAVLRLYGSQREPGRYRFSSGPFGRRDMIVHSPTVFERLRALLPGRR